MIGNNSCGVHSHDGRAGPTTTSRSSRSLTYDGAAAARRRDERGRARAHRRRGRPARRDLPRAAVRSRDRYAAAHPRAASRTSRGASPATTSTSCCPRTASTSRARSSAPRAPASRSSRRRSGSSTSPPRARCSCSATRRLSRPPTHVREVLRARADRPRGLRRRARRRHAAEAASHPSDLGAAPGGRAAGCSSSSAATRTSEADEQARGADATLCARAGRAVDAALRRPGAGARASGRCASPGSARPRACPGEPDTWEGWEDAAVAARRSSASYLRDFRALLDRLRLRRRALRPLRPGLRPHAASTSTSSSAAGIAQLPRVRRRGGRPRRRATAARSRASTATASRAPSCSRRCSAPELVRAFREFKAIWDPDGTA